MGNANDFIIENKRLLGYKGPGGNVTIPPGVTSIGKAAFRGCGSLKTVIIPDSVTDIGKSAFSMCTSLTSVTIPDSVTNIGDAAFSCNSGLMSVTISSGLKSMGHDIFSGCSSLTNVTIRNGVTYIGIAAFKGCSSLQNVIIPDSVTRIAYSAFCECVCLTSITIPNSVTSIEGFAFCDCESLTNVVFPVSVKSIGDHAFWVCSSLTSITISGSGIAIGNSAFLRCSNLTGVAINGSAASIGDRAFNGCNNLKSFDILEKTRVLDKGTFGTKLPVGLIADIGNLYSCMTDDALRQYVLDREIWPALDDSLKTEIFFALEGKCLESVCEELFNEKEQLILGAAILERLRNKNPAASDCAAAVSYMTFFYKTISVETLKEIYEALKMCKNGAKTLKIVESQAKLMEKIGCSVKTSASPSPAAREVESLLFVEGKTRKELEQSFKDCYGMTPRSIPTIRSVDGAVVEPLVTAWLFTKKSPLAQCCLIIPVFMLFVECQ